jgi:hypothetical protein
VYSSRYRESVTVLRGPSTASAVCARWYNYLDPSSFELLPLFSHSPLPMSTANQTAGPSRSDDNFTAIFQVALTEYETVTGKPLRTHPFAIQFDSCHNPQAVSTVLRTKAQAFSKFRNNNEKLMGWLDPIIHILSTFSATIGSGIALVSHLLHSPSLFSDIWF